MFYTIPDYYREFCCTADRCEDTCCAGWQIVIDEKSLRYYRKKSRHLGVYRKGPEDRQFSKRLRRSIHWKEGVFHQLPDRRCTFLNKENLCDLYTALGEKSLCKTCSRYPRHIEEFENVREITLAVSCPEVAGILLQKEEPVRYLTYEKEGEEVYEDFDPFLYSMLVDARDVMRGILQNRTEELRLRVCLVLGLAHDLQVRVNQEEIFTCSEVIERYQGDRAREYVRMKLESQNGSSAYAEAYRMFRHICQLERLKPEWETLLRETKDLLYAGGEEHYENVRREFALWMAQERIDGDPDKRWRDRWEIQCEQLLVYFLHTYFCGSVYDDRIYAKVQMAVVSVWMIQELLMGQWVRNERTLDLEDVVGIVYRYSRELEHSDPNLEEMERRMEEDVFTMFRGNSEK